MAFNLRAGAEYVCIPSVVRELGLQNTVRGVASPPIRPAFEFRSVQGSPSDPGTWHYPEDCVKARLDDGEPVRVGSEGR